MNEEIDLVGKIKIEIFKDVDVFKEAGIISLDIYQESTIEFFELLEVINF
jgi:hypothetical protein